MQRIFYSWQRDLPSKSNRGFIEEALEIALKALGSGEAVFEAVIDRDTLDVPGAPNIVSTIFEKIGAADAFVADVSILDASASKPAPNPNVLVELGYALRALGESRVILVANRHFGRLEQLPFDLRQLRCSVYDCDPEAADKATPRRALADTLQAALRAVLSQPPHRLPDVRVTATRMKMFPGLGGEKETPAVSMSVENHSSAPVFISSFGLVLPSDEDKIPKGIWFGEDIMKRPNAGGRVEPGDRLDFLVDERGFPTASDGQRPICVEVSDRINRKFRSNEAEFAKLLDDVDGANSARGISSKI